MLLLLLVLVLVLVLLLVLLLMKEGQYLIFSGVTINLFVPSKLELTPSTRPKLCFHRGGSKASPTLCAFSVSWK